MEQAGLYFHIPFCKSKCPYCDFFSGKYREDEAEAYCKRLIQEIGKYNGAFDTVYFGGGTPSIIKPHLIGEVLNAAKKQFEIDKNSEITVECNPREDLSAVFKAYKSYGINRISLGMQSAVDSERFALGRSAGRAQVQKAIDDARTAGIDNISLDFMLGIPKQTLASLQESLKFIADAGVQHISAYMLKIEPHTKFYEMQDRLALPDEDAVSEMYLTTVCELEKIGLKQYEISNFALPGFESRHNTKYWRLVPYLGIGKSAHSFWENKRFYYNSAWEVVPDGDGGTREEAIMLGLRLRAGVEKTLIKKPYAPFVEMGLMEERGGRLALTPRGMLVSNTVINALI